MCTQFGGFIVPYRDPAEAVQSSLLDLNYAMNRCKKLFGITKPPLTEETNRKFYEPLLRPETTHIVYVNGSLDPYSTLSIDEENRNNLNPNTESDTIAGGSHCLDFQAFLENPNALQSEVVRFQAHFYSVAKAWLD
jgi:hypothetical protein